MYLLSTARIWTLHSKCRTFYVYLVLGWFFWLQKCPCSWGSVFIRFRFFGVEAVALKIITNNDAGLSVALCGLTCCLKTVDNPCNKLKHDGLGVQSSYFTLYNNLGTSVCSRNGSNNESVEALKSWKNMAILHIQRISMFILSLLVCIRSKYCLGWWECYYGNSVIAAPEEKSENHRHYYNPFQETLIKQQSFFKYLSVWTCNL